MVCVFNSGFAVPWFSDGTESPCPCFRFGFQQMASNNWGLGFFSLLEWFNWKTGLEVAVSWFLLN